MNRPAAVPSRQEVVMRGLVVHCWVSVALHAALAAGACKKAPAPPPPRTDEQAEAQDAGGTQPVRGHITVVADGVVYTALVPTHDVPLLEPPKDLSPVRAEFHCPGREQFVPTTPDPQPDFSMDDMRRLFPDLQEDKIPVEINTESGKFECEVWPRLAPQAVAQFLGLATGARAWWHPCRHEWVLGQPYYDGSTFYSLQPAVKIESGCLYRGCEASAGFESSITDAGAAFDRPGLIVIPRRGPAGTFAILDCAWRVSEPTKIMEGTCEFTAEARALARDWVALGVCPHSGLGHAVYRLARLLRDRRADPHGIRWLRPFSPTNEYYRYRPGAPAAGGPAVGQPAGSTEPVKTAPQGASVVQGNADRGAASGATGTGPAAPSSGVSAPGNAPPLAPASEPVGR